MLAVIWTKLYRLGDKDMKSFARTEEAGHIYEVCV